jgi:UDP-glucose 4-epimerase
MSDSSILVTGGAGYIGSHVVRQLGERGENLVTLDNLSTGFRDAVLYGDFVEGDTGDPDCVNSIIEKYNIEAVLHFAAHTIVPESVSNPLKYYGNNTCCSRNLLACCEAHDVKHFIFSSTAAVYGIPETSSVSEEAPLSPINPYGTSKLMTEMMLRDLTLASSMSHVILRYFNVAGSDPQCRIGQSTEKATLLTKVACETATGKRDKVFIFGTDYPTADGTGVRDYIHVEDLADAHLKALDYLRNKGASVTLNCGYGHGYSVREVLNMVQQVDGKPLNIVEDARRAGDPPELIAAADKIREVLGWQPHYDDLETIVKTSLDWEYKLRERD